MSILSGVLAEAQLMPAGAVHKGDRIYVEEVPYARPTRLTVGWHEVLTVDEDRHGDRKKPKDVVTVRVLPDRMDERNDVLYFNRRTMVRIKR